MTLVERHIIEAYSGLFESLSPVTKLELLEKLAKSLKNDSALRSEDFFSSFGGFSSEKPAKEIAKEIKASRKFRKKDLML